MTIDPSPEEMRRLGHVLADRATDYLSDLGQRRVARRHDSQTLKLQVQEPLPRAPLGVEASLDLFFDQFMPSATLVNHPRFFAYIPGPGSFIGALGEWAAAITNCFVGTWLGGASMAQLELQTIDWLREAMGLPEPCEGIVTSGGSMANLSGIAAARSNACAPTDATLTLYTSCQAHYSIDKSAKLLGFPQENIRSVATDASQRLCVDALMSAIEKDRACGRTPFLVCATAGTTNTGAIDPLQEIADLCERQDLWLHVDAAYGGAVALLEEERSKLAGIERADSITLDPHKWLYTPFDCGCLLTRRVDALVNAFTAEGSYMQDVPREEVNFFERGPELSRGNRALKLWLLLRSVGIDTIAAAIGKDLQFCRLARELLAADPRVHIITEPSLSIFTFAIEGGESVNRDLFERILEDGYLMLSTTQVAGEYVLRLCFANHRTTEDDVRSSMQRILDLIET